MEFLYYLFGFLKDFLVLYIKKFINVSNNIISNIISVLQGMKKYHTTQVSVKVIQFQITDPIRFKFAEKNMVGLGITHSAYRKATKAGII